MLIRRLRSDEWDKVRALRIGESDPNPNSSIIIVAEENGKVIAHIAAERLWHIGGLEVDSDWRGRYLVPLLLHELAKYVPGPDPALCYISKDAGRLGKLLQHFGLVEMTGVRWFRWLGGKCGKFIRPNYKSVAGH